jgi:hypothetical protein
VPATDLVLAGLLVDGALRKAVSWRMSGTVADIIMVARQQHVHASPLIMTHTTHHNTAALFCKTLPR